MSLVVARIKLKKLPRDTRKCHEYLMAVIRTVGAVVTVLLQCFTVYLLIRGGL